MSIVEASQQQGWRVHQVLNGYIRWLRAQKQGAAMELREDSPTCDPAEDQLDELLETLETPPAATL